MRCYILQQRHGTFRYLSGCPSLRRSQYHHRTKGRLFLFSCSLPFFSSSLFMSFQYSTTLAGRSGRGDIFDWFPLLERMQASKRENGILRGAVHSSQSTCPESGQCRYRANLLHATGGSTSSSTTLPSLVSSWSFLLPSLQRAAACGNQRQFLFETRRRLPLLEDELAETPLTYLVHWLRLFRDAGVCLPPPRHESRGNGAEGEVEDAAENEKGHTPMVPNTFFILSLSHPACLPEGRGEANRMKCAALSRSTSSTPTVVAPLSASSAVSRKVTRFEVSQDTRLCDLHAQIVDIVEEELFGDHEKEGEGKQPGEGETKWKEDAWNAEDENMSRISASRGDYRNEMEAVSFEGSTPNAPRKSRKERQRMRWKRQWEEDMVWHKKMAEHCSGSLS